VIVDQWGLVRLGIGAVLRASDVRVIAEESRARDGLMCARRDQPSLVVFGAHLDVPVAEAVRQATALDPAPLVLVLLDAASREDPFDALVREARRSRPPGGHRARAGGRTAGVAHTPRKRADASTRGALGSFDDSLARASPARAARSWRIGAIRPARGRARSRRR